jgi:prepilin-type processing-associated H-X9-DG protein/prepilin-type N-terminal cleavage/methylation domain-containing protein
MRRRTAAGFTLIELLVVIGVIGGLAGMLLPALHKARGCARSAGCVSNLKQMGYALSLYMDDNDGYIPRRGQGVQKLTQINRESDWFNCLLPYAGSEPYWQLVAEGKRPKEGERHVFLCPAAADPGWLYFLPYGMNMYLSPWIRPAQHKFTEVPRPASLVFLADAPGPYSATVPSSQPYSVSARHNGSANLVFLDGHVQGFESAYLGCGVGDPHHGDVRWETGTGGINQTPVK